jgi:hypothetical protein
MLRRVPANLLCIVQSIFRKYLLYGAAIFWLSRFKTSVYGSSFIPYGVVDPGLVGPALFFRVPIRIKGLPFRIHIHLTDYKVKRYSVLFPEHFNTLLKILLKHM